MKLTYLFSINLRVFCLFAKLAVFVEDLKPDYIHIRRKRGFIINRNGINPSISVVYVFDAGFLLGGGKELLGSFHA